MGQWSDNRYFDADISTQWGPPVDQFGPHFARINNEAVPDDTGNGIVHKNIVIDVVMDNLHMQGPPQAAKRVTLIEVTPRVGSSFPFAEYSFLYFDIYSGATLLGTVSYDILAENFGFPWSTLDSKTFAVSLTYAQASDLRCEVVSDTDIINGNEFLSVQWVRLRYFYQTSLVRNNSMCVRERSMLPRLN